MLTIFFRTVIIYIFLIIVMRLMGKRQLGELDMSEFVITILLSEIAALPISNKEMPISHALVAILTLAFFEILVSGAILKIPLAKKLLAGRPAVIISHGRLDKKTMKKVRISVEELVAQVRQNGIYDLEEVDYAILEENGKMSIIPKSRYRQPDLETLGLQDQDSGVMHILISDGVVNTHNLDLLNRKRSWLDTTLKRFNCSTREVLCMTVDDAGKLYLVMQDGSTKSEG